MRCVAKTDTSHTTFSSPRLAAVQCADRIVVIDSRHWIVLRCAVVQALGRQAALQTVFAFNKMSHRQFASARCGKLSSQRAFAQPGPVPDTGKSLVNCQNETLRPGKGTLRGRYSPCAAEIR